MSGAWLFCLASLFLALVPGSTALAQDPLGTVELQAAGPLDGFRCSAGWESTQVHIELGAGERQRLLVPLLGRRLSAQLEPRAELEEGTQGVELLAQTLDWPQPWQSLPRLLQSRTYPPLEHNGPQIGALQWSWLALALVIALALRRRPGLALALGSSAALVLYLWIPGAEIQQPRTARVLEGDGAGHWLEVRGAHDRLVLDSMQPGWLARLPAASELFIERLAGERDTWAICSEGARLFFSTRAEVRGTPGPASPAGHAFEAVWVRLPGEPWSARGPWQGAGPLPGVDPAAPDPPGWLVSGLPQGRGILVGRLVSSAGVRSWMRLVGFE